MQTITPLNIYQNTNKKITFGNINTYKPNTLKSTLNNIKNENSDIDIFIKAVSNDEKLSNIKIKNFLAQGSSAIVFETDDNKILKLTKGNHFPLNRPTEDFDVPIYEKGKIGKIHYYLEEKLYQHGLSEPFVETIKERIKNKGYRTFDIFDGDINQIGLSKDGKLYLLDPECAKYKTIFHAIFDKAKKFILKNT